VQDRTVIEDTESSIDLVARGWRLHNHPGRMAWSATPSDFGALLIQRRRWANGGLLILPKLLRVLLRRPWRAGRLAEGALRAHYLVSIAGVNLGLAVLFLFPFEGVLDSWWFPVAALPYFVLYARDLAAVGHRARDVVAVYALNLLLLPVNLGGVARSLGQALTGRKSAFGRTPKVRDRTAVPRGYVLAEWALLPGLLGVLAADLLASRWVHAGFVGANAALLAWALWRLVGWRESLEDLRSAAAPPVPAETRLAA
jgi:cellulose synthase (UDP-forming)